MKFLLKFGFEKRGIFFLKFYFYIKRSMEISGKGLLYFYQQASTMIDNQTNHITNRFSLTNITLAIGQTMSAFVLWSMTHCAVFL